MMTGFIDLPIGIRAEIYPYLPATRWNSRAPSQCSNTFRMDGMRINREIYQELRDEMFKDLEWPFRIEIRLGQADELRTILAKALTDIRKHRDFSQARVRLVRLKLVEGTYWHGEFVGVAHDV